MAGVSVAPHVRARIRTACANIGFEPPPFEVHVRFLRQRLRWMLYAFAPSGTREKLRAWLEAYGPTVVQHPTTVDSTVLRATFESLPSSWWQLLEEFEVRDIRLFAEGQAVLVIEGDRASVATKIPHTVEAVVDVDHVRAAASLLTPLQHRTMLAAFQAGYYDVPKRVNLAELATMLHSSQAALSELLRRGEERLIERYFLVHTDLPRDAFDESAAWSDGGQAFDPTQKAS